MMRYLTAFALLAAADPAAACTRPAQVAANPEKYIGQEIEIPHVFCIAQANASFLCHAPTVKAGKPRTLFIQALAIDHVEPSLAQGFAGRCKGVDGFFDPACRVSAVVTPYSHSDRLPEGRASDSLMIYTQSAFLAREGCAD